MCFTSGGVFFEPCGMIECKIHFSIFYETLWEFASFFEFSWFFWRTFNIFKYKDHFAYLWLMLVCFTLGGVPQRFFGMHYHVLPRINIHIINCVTILMLHLHQYQCSTAFSSLPDPATFTCSKLTMKTLEQGVKYVQSKQ